MIQPFHSRFQNLHCLVPQPILCFPHPIELLVDNVDAGKVVFAAKAQDLEVEPCGLGKIERQSEGCLRGQSRNLGEAASIFLDLQGWEKRVDQFKLGEWVMPASFKWIILLRAYIKSIRDLSLAVISLPEGNETYFDSMLVRGV
ncbi:hypothetical protein RJT34_20151 [Clitoria ternatea]|uniref:Uncharacterized protein n=1 Tax=Clitoria ternatea TaxID=43366 RepID=A0AAN9ISE1_CLITE